MVKRGGEAIASGGYGCIFKPALKCENEHSRSINTISKLMSESKAVKEIDEIANAKNIIKNIPNYTKYFAVENYRICIPAPLDEEDQIRFDKECIAPLKTDFTTVNRNITNYRAILSPDLGSNLVKAFELVFNETTGKNQNQNQNQNLIRFNNTSSEFLLNGIAKLSELGFYHTDVKPENIMTDVLYDKESDTINAFTYMKLIDFGLILPHNSGWEAVNPFPSFNTPFSTFMFNKDVIKSINKLLERVAIKTSDDNCFKRFITQKVECQVSNNATFEKVFKQKFASLIDDYIFESQSHIGYMLYVGSIVYNMPQEDVYADFLHSMINDYCSKVVLGFIRYKKNGIPEFDVDKYWNDVYRINLDIWGFLTIFLILTMILKNTNNESAASYYKNIVVKYLYNIEWATKPIPVAEIADALHNVTDIYKNAETMSRDDNSRYIDQVKTELELHQQHQSISQYGSGKRQTKHKRNSTRKNNSCKNKIVKTPNCKSTIKKCRKIAQKRALIPRRVY